MSIREKHAKPLTEHVTRDQTSGPIYSNPLAGYHKAWNQLDPSEQEAAMVFSLGKMLWIYSKAMVALAVPFSMSRCMMFTGTPQVLKEAYGATAIDSAMHPWLV